MGTTSTTLSTMPTPNPPHTTGFGLLGMTWRPVVTPDEQAFAAMKTAIANGATIWSSSSIYGIAPEEPTAGLALLHRYFSKYPDDADKVTLFIRACCDGKTLAPLCDRDSVRASVEECNRVLGGVKKMDIFGPARIDPNVPVEETVGALKELVEDGQIGAVGLSEVGEPSIRRAQAVCPISVVEIEFSLWSTEMLINGVAAAYKELDIPILTYAPLGYGFLTARSRNWKIFPRVIFAICLVVFSQRYQCLFHPLIVCKPQLLHTDHFSTKNFPKNLELVDKVNEFSKRRGVTPAQLALAWIRAHSNTAGCGVIISIPGATAASRVEENSKLVPLSAEEKEQLDSILRSFNIHGERQIPGMESILWT